MEFIKNHRRSLVILLTPVLLSPIVPLHEQMGLTPRACNCLYMLLIMAVYWCTEVIHLAITALLPLMLAPLMGILEADVVCKNYFKDKIALFFGTMVIATSIQHSGLHRRIALTFIKLFGTNPRFLMLGFMLPTWFLSMWVSNSATAVMMVSILNCVIEQLRVEHKQLDSTECQRLADMKSNTSPESFHVAQPSEDVELQLKNGEATIEEGVNLATIEEGVNCNNQDTTSLDSTDKSTATARFEMTAKCLCLAVCYSATCGGVATLTGSGTNLVFYDNIFEVGNRLEYDFKLTLPRWIGFAMPISILLFVICWVWLQVLFIGCRTSFLQTKEDKKRIADVINKEYSSLGRVNWQEGVTLAHFILLIVLWLGRYPAKAGGWGLLFPEGYVTDATAAMLVAISVLFMPKYPPLFLRMKSSRPFESLLSWQHMTLKVNWGVIFLVAGGFALADCVNKSGLSAAIGSSLQFVSNFPVWAMILTICCLTALITEFTSNVVISSLIQPILADIAVQGKINPVLLMAPSCIASSFAFALPVATPPNAIVYSAGVLRIWDMVKAGVLLNIVAILVVLIAGMAWLPIVFDFQSFSYDTNSTSPFV
ncbi:solute carrier family 13 member 2-like [Watersipora subatra]|uniref:solute carrier family 13 member 2-like n=1 Tax=Watersipora subatra TaxID=2589382 RepID=UPI00355B6778